MKIQKKYQGIIPNGKIMSSEFLSDVDTYSCNYLNNKFKDIDESRYYQVGETWGYDETKQPIYANGFITSSATSIRFDLYLPKSLEHIKDVTLNNMSVIVRGISGYIPSSSGITSSDENITFTLYKRDGNRLSIVITGATAFSNATNNTPVSVEIRTYNFSFS